MERELSRKWKCGVCGYIYDASEHGVPFEDLPETWRCPVCGAPISAFSPLAVPVSQRESGPKAGSVASALVAQLVELGVRHVYGIPGDSNLPLADAIRRSGDMDLILVRHEETAAFMASARGKIDNALGVCMSIAGPGATNLLTGLADAARDRSPVLALVGQVPEVRLGSESFQEIDQISLFRPLAQYAETLVSPSQAANLVATAARKALAHRGVSVLSLPTDVLDMPALQGPTLGSGEFAGNPPVPSTQTVEEAARIIAEARRPMILLGWGGRFYGSDVLALAERVGGFVATTSRAKGVVPETHERVLGVLGSIGTPYASRAAQLADLILVLGSGFRQSKLLPDAKIVQVDIEPSQIGKSFRVLHGIVGDVGETVRELLEVLPPKETEPEYQREVAGLMEQKMAWIKGLREQKGQPLHPGFVITCLNETVPENAIITVDVGDHTYWFYKAFLCQGQRTFLSANIASMGFAFPAALAASLEHRDTPVICIAGDGGFGMLMADFTTAVREELPVKVILFNDGRLKNIAKEERLYGMETFAVDFPNPDFAEFANSMGGRGIRVRAPGELLPALQEALATHDLPFLVEIMVSQNVDALPTKRAL